MTIREKALNNLIEAEAYKIRNALIERLEERLDEINKDMKQYPNEEMPKEYVEISERLIKIKRAGRNDVLDIDYDSVRVPPIC
jgi:transposase-like protein